MEQSVSFSVTDINNILGALGKIPAEYSMNLIMFIKQTADAQLKTEEVAQPEATPAE